jgi:hypothetical protein
MALIYHFLALNVLIEIWYAVVQVASHSKNPRAHHGSQRKLSTALSSDLTSFIATNFSNDDVIYAERRKDPPAAVSPMSSPWLGNPWSNSILFGAAWWANRIAENLRADRAASGQWLSTRTIHFPDRHLIRRHHRHPVADNDQDSGSGCLAALQTPSSAADDHRCPHLQLLTGDRMPHRWSVGPCDHRLSLPYIVN